MTRSLSPENYELLKRRRLEPRDFVRFVVRTYDTGVPVEDCYWSDVGRVTADVIDMNTGGTLTRLWQPAGGLIKISDIPLVSNLTVQKVEITLSQASDRINELLRAYDCKQGVAQVWRGLLDPETYRMAAPGIPRFNGTIDQAPITTPKENDPSGNVKLTCTGNTQELMRSNPDTSSDASQRLRDPDDEFFADAGVVGSWQQFWGKEGGALRTTHSLPGMIGAALGAVFKQ
jgi:hypothetical protein